MHCWNHWCSLRRLFVLVHHLEIKVALVEVLLQLEVVGQALAKGWAAVWVVAHEHHALLLLDAAKLGDSLVALAALMELLARMPPHVQIEVCVLGECLATVGVSMHLGVLRVQFLEMVQVQRDVEALAALVALKRLLFGVPLDVVSPVALLAHVAGELALALVDLLACGDAGRFLLPKSFSGCGNAFTSSAQGSCSTSFAWVSRVWVLVVPVV